MIFLYLLTSVVLTIYLLVTGEGALIAFFDEVALVLSFAGFSVS